MPSIERQTVSFKDVFGWLFLSLLVGVAVGYGISKFSATGDEDDRPPIIVSNGSIDIEEVESGNDYTTNGGRGSLAKAGGPVDGRDIWRHAHATGAPKRLHVLVEGADGATTTGCPATYFAQNITDATISYSIDGGFRDVIVSKESGNKPVDISVQQSAVVNQTRGTHTLTLDAQSGAALVNVKIAWRTGNSERSVTCQFGAAAAPRVVFLQTSK